MTPRIASAFLTLLLVAFAWPLGAQVRGLIVGPGAERYPIAVSPLKNLGPDVDDPRFSDGTADVIARDLDLSGWFRIIDRATYIEDPRTSGITLGHFDFRDWSTLGAEALVKGGFELTGDSLVTEFRLFDVFQRGQIVGKRYTGRVQDYRRMAHKFADEIILQFTGTPGVFDTRVAYVSTGSGRFKEIYIAHLDGSERIQVTDNRSINLSPSWSPDGRSVIYTSYKDGGPKVYRYDLASGKDIEFSGQQGLNLSGSWSADGKRVALAIENKGNVDIYLLDSGGTIQKRLTRNPMIDVSPAWSPSGEEIAFVSNRSGSPQIYVVDVRTARTRRLTYTGSYNTSPSWSAQGERIAYVGRSNGRFNVFAISPDGGDPQQLTANAGDNEDPSWSPDGRFLLFSSNRTGRYRIYMMRANGDNQQRLTSSAGDDTNPAWSPRLRERE